MIVSPSILSADHVNLERDVRELEKAGADNIHIDIMDGNFVKYMTWGASTVTGIKNITNLPLEIHLMIDRPEFKIHNFLNTEAHIIIIHPESTFFLRDNLLKIKKAGLNAGVALKLETPVKTIENCIELLDVVLIISCDEGFGGQAFNSLALDKILFLSKLRRQKNHSFYIEVDGGLDLTTVKQSYQAGADVFVLGSYIFKQSDKKNAIKSIKNMTTN